ncbi:internalin [Acinetobacter gerneri]|nr:internalin [Acinetobacter gerneri]
MMNKKLLLCGLIASGLLLTACVKKETPKEDEQEKVETQQQTEQPAKFENLQEVEQHPQQPVDNSIPTRVEVDHEETNNTTTTIRREYHDSASEQHDDAKPRAEQVSAREDVKPKAESVKPKAESTLQNNGDSAQSRPAKPKSAQSEDDAVAAAIAAATPALKN